MSISTSTRIYAYRIEKKENKVMSNNVINIIKFSKVKDYNMFVKKYLNNDEMDLNLVAK